MKKDSSGNYIIQPALNQLPGQFNANSVNYSGTHTSVPPTNFTDSMPSSESSQKWIPAVRPAPVGSEAPISSQQKILDSKPDISQNYYFPQTSNYPTYDANYYARLAQSQGYPTKPGANPVTPNTQLPSSTQAYQQNLTPSTQYGSVQTPYAYQNNPTYPNQSTDLKSQYGATQYNTPYTPSNYPTTNFPQQNTQVNSYVSQQSAYYPQQTYNIPASPNHNVIDQGKQNNSATSTQPQSSMPTQNSGYVNPAGQTLQQYSVPSTYQSQSPYNNYSTYAGYAYPSTGQYQYGQNSVQQQWPPSNLSQNQHQQALQGQQILPNQQPSQGQSMVDANQLNQGQTMGTTNQLNQGQTMGTTNQLNQGQIGANQLQQPQQTATSEAKPWTQISNQYSYNPNSTVSITNPTYTAGYSTLTTSPYQSTVSATAATTYSQYPQHYQPNPNYPQHLQYTPVADASHQYTRAGQLNLSQTNSSQTSLQGQTYAAQYNTNPSQTPLNEHYYSHQYGYQITQYTNAYGTTAANPVNTAPVTPKPKENEVLSPQSPMTYMQASNSSITTTFSQQKTSSLRRL
ncbi:hypothetical protein LSTR_LSTR017228 [Laodelphax striatellus]|uniref:Uncharacterized protein n=1 Tax=Laodelphax striatellus TaxID=195883 RepID=A0A482XGH6_LAOST|nr:hypothetical protein LSTR_LSTR017228 [Laodelphax striatellus]